jgi:nitrile hydratase
MDEIKAGASSFIPQPGYPPETAQSSRAFVVNPKSYAAPTPAPPRFAPGQSARARLSGHSGHTRMPAYVRGRTGVVEASHGGHILPDASARGEPRGEPLYTVSFAAADLWPEAGQSRDRVYVDLWESYLEPA